MVKDIGVPPEISEVSIFVIINYLELVKYWQFKLDFNVVIPVQIGY